MNRDLNALVKQRLKAVHRAYGKVGLLIDDAPAAGTRVARELYGAETLPGWWLVMRTLKDGAEALEAFIQVFRDPPTNQRAWGVSLIDRFLPIREEKERPTAWDAPRRTLSPEEENICLKMQNAVAELTSLAEQQGEDRRFEYKLITSYPHVPFGPGSQGETAIPWQTRSMEILVQLRRKLQTRRALLHYGPEDYASIVGQNRVPGYNQDAADQWRAKRWRESIEGLAEALLQAGETTPVVLFTGAGASIVQGDRGAGIPPTWWLLEKTCLSVVEDPRNQDRPRGRLRTVPNAYFGHEHFPRKRLRSFPEDVPPIDWLIGYLSRSDNNSALDLDCRLETIFSRELNIGSRQATRFYEYFRSRLELFDHGFLYHHWLLAQMPWTRIITTNFDSFHERAAFAAAAEFDASSSLRLNCLARGNVFPFQKVTAARFSELAGMYRLFKPYGNLLSPEELALGEEKLRSLRDRLSFAFQGLRRAKRGWLVVIGHAMKDAHISNVLEVLNGPKGMLEKQFELIWVIPEAFSRCRPKQRGDGTHRPIWEHWINSKMTLRDRDDGKEAARFSGPMPGTALEFTYDLWTEYQRRKNEGTGFRFPRTTRSAV